MNAALPEGVFHLLSADDKVTSTFGGYVAVCGEILRASRLPPSRYTPEGEFHGDPQYCPECVRDAIQGSAEPVELREL